VPLLWGGTFIAGRIASTQLAPVNSALLRFTFAAIALLVYLGATEGFSQVRRLTAKQWAGCLGLGLTGIFLYNIFFFAALGILPAGRTSMFVPLNPVVTVLLAYFIFRETLSPRKIVGMALALIGVWIVVTQGDLLKLASAFGRGEVLMLGAVSSWAVYTLISRRMLDRLSPLLATTMAACTGLILLLLYALATQNFAQTISAIFAISTDVLLSLIFLGVLGTAVAFVFYNQALKTLGAAKTVVFNNLVPIFGVLLAWLILHEPVTPSLLIGGAIAVAGVFIVNWVSKK
jgi:drug/metabolite transporter (DMT)-like permease